MPTCRRSLEDTLNPFPETGFRIDRVLDPGPTSEFQQADPRHYRDPTRHACFLCLRASSIPPA